MTKLSREQLHAQLDALLDSPQIEQATRFWMFVTNLSQGRGVAEELAEAAMEMTKENHGPLTQENYGDWGRGYAGAVLFHLLKRVDLQGRGAVLPDEFSRLSCLGHAHNLATGKNEQIDVFSRKLEPQKSAAVAKCLIVAAVKYLEEKERISEAEARRRLLPEEGHPDRRDREGGGFYRTWRDWKKTAEAKGWVQRAQAAARREIEPDVYDVGADQVAEWWSYATNDRWKKE